MTENKNNEYDNSPEVISAAKDAGVDAGNYEGRFVGKKRIPSKNPEWKDNWQWEFEGDDRTYFGFCPATEPTVKTQYGCLLACLIGRKPEAGMQIDPAAYIGKKYMLFYSPDPKTGKVKLTAFRPCNLSKKIKPPTNAWFAGGLSSNFNYLTNMTSQLYDI